MNRQLVIGIVAVFVVIIAGMFIYAYVAKERLNTTENEGQTPTENETTPYDYITRIDGKHFFIDGTHSVVGEIMMPTPCDLLEGDATVAESSPEQVTLNFNVINNADTCAQVQTSQRFRIDFEASEQAVITARFMGRNVELNLVPPAAGETPDDFELFIKG